MWEQNPNIGQSLCRRSNREGGRNAKSVQHGQRVWGAARCPRVQFQYLKVLGSLGGTKQRHHQLRQHRLRHAHRLPVHHHGGLDCHIVLGNARNMFISVKKKTKKKDRKEAELSSSRTAEICLSLFVLFIFLRFQARVSPALTKLGCVHFDDERSSIGFEFIS